jgi:hypothetical protein
LIFIIFATNKNAQMKILRFAIALIFLTPVQFLSAQTTRVLFLGNSYTDYNNLPSLVASLAQASGVTMTVDSYTPGGYTFQQHSTDATAIGKINSQPWDYVVLQEQSQRPSFPPSQVASQVFPYAEVLDSLIRNNNPCSETVFYMTWGRKNGDAANCPNYAPLCTYDGMQARLRESYMQMGMDNGATVSPVGAAWKLVRTWNPNFDLYVPDESHPSLHGSYLAACVHYATLLHRSPVGNSFISSLPPADALLLQSAAHAVVIDSIYKWYEYGDIPLASFSYTSQGNSVQFVNHSLNATSFTWDFGDGNASSLQTPVHQYATSGAYQVTLTVSDSCKESTTTLTVQTGTTGLAEELSGCVTVISNEQIEIDEICSGKMIQVSGYDLNGRTIPLHLSKSGFFSGIRLSDQTAPGIYLIRLITEKGPLVLRLKR